MAQTKDRTSVPSIPIFCLGSRDFLCTAEIVSDPPAIFLDPEETGIPKLRRYLEDDGERRNLTDAIVTMTSFYEFLSRTSQCSSSPAAHAAADALEIYNTISGVEAAYKNRLEDLLVDVKQEYASLLAVVKAALDEAERQSPRIFKDKEKFKWNQYRAMMRQYGQYENGNLNADLTNEILPAIQQSWYKAVNTSIPLEIKVFCDDLRKELNKMVENICLQPGRHSSSSLRKSLGIESFIDDLSRMDLDCTKSTQRQGSRSWEPLMKGMLDDQYNKVSAEKGPGMYKRMKANQRYIEDNASNLYGKLYKITEKLFSDTVNNINECNREEFSRFTKTMRQFLLGADVNITPELAARGEAEKVVKKVLRRARRCSMHAAG
ncbi:Glycosyltransferase family 22 protein [Mycena venus]|uniref:Glycosyltransferase family 22 protein n=1 Tax=Mycena venus TaxID=2733690 RepID=A0A8H7CRG6_9AGAR|nr:Glycosyltransferase family 22 protein [Mycena venus]